MNVFRHDPESTLDYQVRWGDFLGTGDYISASSWVVSSHVAVSSATYTNTTATAFITVASAARVAGATYTITNRIGTFYGAANVDQSFVLRIEEF